MVEAHARAVAASVVPRATKGIPGRTMDMITQELMFVLEGSDGAAERCAAMESLFWLQVSRTSYHMPACAQFGWFGWSLALACAQASWLEWSSTR